MLFTLGLGLNLQDFLTLELHGNNIQNRGVIGIQIPKCRLNLLTNLTLGSNRLKDRCNSGL